MSARSALQVASRQPAPLPSGWVWPFWLERQLDPRSASFLPLGHLPGPVNLTQRNWTAVGTFSSADKGMVDPRGLLTPRPGGWSLDWWIGAEDRWHFPSRAAGVRQQLVADTPVVETAMRVLGGDAIQRVYAVPYGLAVMEIRNDTPTPIAVGLAIRPYNPEGLAKVERIALDDRTVVVDGRSALHLPKRPQRMAASTLLEGDAVHRVTSQDLAVELPPGFRCEAGMATATFLVPLAHRQTLRVVVPLDGGRRTRRSGPAPQHADPPADSDAVVRAWQAQTANRGMRLVLPEGRLASAVEANRRSLLLFHEGTDGAAGPSSRDEAAVLVALDQYGFHRESAEVLAGPPTRRRGDGDGSALWAMAEHWRLTGSLDHVDAEGVVRAACALLGTGRGRHRRLAGADLTDDLWSLRGLLDGASLLRALGVHELAAECDRSAASRRSDVTESVARLSGPLRRFDPDLVGALVACVPLRLLAVDDPAIIASAEAVRQHAVVGGAVADAAGHSGLGTGLTLQLASVELEAGDRAALERLGWLLDVASPTFGWPAAIHPVLGGGSLGAGHDRRVTADFLSFVRRLLVREVGPQDLALCSMIPDAWLGQPVEVHAAPTHLGPVSFAVRYHGDRPALLWDLQVRDDIGRIRLTAPGLDPTWSTTDAKGEALLAARVAVDGRGRDADDPPLDIAGSFS